MFDVKSQIPLGYQPSATTAIANPNLDYQASQRILIRIVKQGRPLTLGATCSHFVLMPLKFPLSVRRFRGVHGTVDAVIIKDSAGRGISLPCEEMELRREIAKLFTPAEAEELARRIARWLTDEHQTEAAIRLRQDEMASPHSWAYKQQNG